jgi:D-lactate dehydrogenase
VGTLTGRQCTFHRFPDINSENGIRQYSQFMNELSEMVAIKHQGSLKAEHGTGRNMAPFVEKSGAAIFMPS